MLTENEKKARLGKITSSVIYDVIHSPYAAYRKIMGLDTFAGNQQTRIGDALEEPVLKLASEELELKGEKAPFRKHPIFDWAADSCDATFKDDSGSIVAIGEIKTHGMSVARGYDDDTGEIPDRVALQAHWHLIHWPEVDVCYVCPLLGGWKLQIKTYEVRRDKDLQGYLLEAAQGFHMRFIEPKQEPPPDWTSMATEAIAAMFPEDNGSTVEAPKHIADLCYELYGLRKEMSQKDRRIKELQNQIRLFMGPNSHLSYNGIQLASLTNVKRKSYMVAETEYRRLNLAK